MLLVLVTLVVIVIAVNVILNLRMKDNIGEDSNRKAEPEHPND